MIKWDHDNDYPNSRKAPIEQGLKKPSDYISCSHGRAADFYVDTGFDPEKEESQSCQLVAYQCSSYSRFLNGDCSTCGENNEKCWLFGYNPYNKASPPPSPQTFFMLSNPEEPFCAHHYRFEMSFKRVHSNLGAKFFLHVSGSKANGVFELPNEHFSENFARVITIDKNLGRLMTAIGFFVTNLINTFDDLPKIDSLKIDYMSNMNKTIREEFSVNFVADNQDDFYYFNRRNLDGDDVSVSKN